MSADEDFPLPSPKKIRLSPETSATPQISENMDEDTENFYGDESPIKDSSEIASSVTLVAEALETPAMPQEIYTLPGLDVSDHEPATTPTGVLNAQKTMDIEVATMLTSLLGGPIAEMDLDSSASGNREAEGSIPSVQGLGSCTDGNSKAHEHETSDTHNLDPSNPRSEDKTELANPSQVAEVLSTQALNASNPGLITGSQSHLNSQTWASDPSLNDRNGLSEQTPLRSPGIQTTGTPPVLTEEIPHEHFNSLSSMNNDKIHVGIDSSQISQSPRISTKCKAGEESEALQQPTVNGHHNAGADMAMDLPPEQAEFEYDSSPYESSSDDSSDSSDEDSDDSDEDDYEMLDPVEQARRLMEADDDSDGEGNGKGSANGQLRTVNEKPEEIISIPNIEVTPDMAIEELGQVERALKNMILIRAKTTGEYQVLESGSLLCLRDRKVIGVVSETLGKVQQPLYCVRFTNAESIAQAAIQQDTTIFYVPQHSTFVFTKSLRGLKGSDASNIHDEEIGEDEMEFSDDEAEAEYKRTKRQRLARRGGRGGRDSSQILGTRGNRNHRPVEYVTTLTYEDGNGAEELYTPLSRPSNLYEIQKSSSPMGEYPQEVHSCGSRGSRGRGYRGRGMDRGRGRGRGFSNGSRPSGPNPAFSSSSTPNFTATAHQRQPQFHQGQPPFNQGHPNAHYGQSQFNQEQFQYNGGHPQFAANFQAPHSHQPNPQYQHHTYSNGYSSDYHGQPTGQLPSANNAYAVPYQPWQQMANMAQAQTASHPLPAQRPPATRGPTTGPNDEGFPPGAFVHPAYFAGHFPNHGG